MKKLMFLLISVLLVLSIQSIHSTNNVSFGFSVHGFNHLKGVVVENACSDWIRTDILWNGSYALGSYSCDCLGYKECNQKLLGILDYHTMNWSDTFTLDDWRTRVNETVRHYNNSIYAWEIWNEPNVYDYQYGYLENCSTYVDMLKEAYSIIKGINQSYIVVGSALSDTYDWEGTDDWEDWLIELTELGAHNYMDVWSIHLYSGQKFSGAIKEIYDAAKRPVWVTEIGHNATTYGEDGQADFLDNGLKSLVNGEVKPQLIFVYGLYGDFGVVDENYNHRASYNVFVKYACGEQESTEEKLWFESPQKIGALCFIVFIGCLFLYGVYGKFS